MIGSWRGLAVLAMLAALALALALVDRPGAPADPALVSGLDPQAIQTLDGPGFSLAVQAGKASWRAPAGDADPAAIDRMMTALRGARWHRRAAVDRAGELRGTLAIGTAHDHHTIGLGQPLAGTDQVWLVIDGDDARLVDGWVAAALFPTPLALRVRHPLDGALRGGLAISSTAASGEIVELFAISGTTLSTLPDHVLRLAPEALARLAAALDGLEIVALPPGTPPPAPATALGLRTGAMAVTEAGPCSDERVLIATSAGAGCVTRAAWDAVVAAIAPLRGPPEAIVDRAPAAGAKRVVLVDGTAVDLVKIGAAFDPDRVAELAAALAAPAALASGTAKVTGALDVDGTTLQLFADGAVARAGEPVRLRPGPGAIDILRRPGEAFRDPRLWREEPTTIATITIDGKAFARGAVIGEWQGAGAPAALEALATALAAPVALGPAPRFVAPAHRVELEIRRPDGETARHALALTGDCHGMVDARSVILPPALCELVGRAR